MGIKSPLILSGVMTLAACSNGPSEQQLAQSQTKMAACSAEVIKTSGLKVSDIKASVAIPKKAGPGAPDFTVTAALVPYTETVEYKDKKIEASVSGGISFTGVSGKFTASVSGYQDSIKNGGNNQRFSQDASQPYKNADLNKVGEGLQKCADAAAPKMK